MAVLNPNQLAVESSLSFPPSKAALPSAALLAGATAGALAAGRAGDALGPATSLAALVAPAFAAGSLLASFSTSLGWLCLARALAGAGAGATSTLVPRYLADVSPPARRGALGAAHQVVVCVGIVAAMLAGLPYEKAGSGGGGGKSDKTVFFVSVFAKKIEPWRVALAAGALPALLLALVSSSLAPESPSWLAFVGRRDDAAISLKKLRGGGGGIGGSGLEDEEGGGRRVFAPSSSSSSSSPLSSPSPVPAMEAMTDSVSPLSTTALAGGGAGGVGGTKPLLRTTSNGGTPLTPRRGHGTGVEDFASSLEAFHSNNVNDGDDHHRRTPPPPSALTSTSNAPSSSSSFSSTANPALLLASARSHPIPLLSSSATGAGAGTGGSGAGGGTAGATGTGGANGASSSNNNNSSSSTTGGGLLQLLRAHRRAVSLALGLALAQQASGINTVVLYSTSVLAAAGSSRPILAGAGVASLNAVASAVSAAAADRVGRRPLLLGSYSAMALSLALLSASPHFPQVRSLAVGPIVAVVALLLYVAAFAAGAGPITWLYMAEVLPEEAQGGAGSLAAAGNWLANLLVGSTFPVLLAKTGVTGAYGLYAVLNVVCLFFVRARVVETARRPLAEARAAVANG